MGLFRLVTRWHSRVKLTDMADAIASRSLEPVWPLVQQRVARLGPHELRGYVRARGSEILREQTEHAITTTQGARPSHVETLLDLATTSLVKLIEARQRTIQALNVTRRRAA